MRTAALVLALLATLPGVARAHGHLRSSVPAAGAHLATAPRTLRLDFSEAPELAFTTVHLVDATGREVALGTLGVASDSRRAVVTGINGPLAGGTYTVRWQMAGADGHPVRGHFDFVVAPGAAAASAPAADTLAGVVPAPMASHDQVTPGGMRHHDVTAMPQGEGFGAESAGYVAIRWLQFAALLLAIGAVAFHYLVLGRLRTPYAESMAARADGIAAAIGWWAVLALAATLLLRLAAQSWAMHGARDAWNAEMISQMVRNTTWGLGWLIQLAGVVLAAAAWYRARAMHRVAPDERPARGAWRMAVPGVALLALAPALSGHAASAPRLRALAVLGDWLHVLGASSWLGTLAVLLAVVLLGARRHDAETRSPFLRVLVDAFSPVALCSAALAAATGVFAAWLHVGTIPNLWQTRYGVTLLIKLGVLAAVALTGLYNWRVVRPSLGSGAAAPRFRRSATAEVAIAVVVLLVTAVLVASPTSMDVLP